MSRRQIVLPPEPPRGTILDEGYWRSRGADVRDFPALASIPNENTQLGIPEDIPHWLDNELSLNSQRYFIYMTGGLDCGPHHELIFRLSSHWGLGTIVGLESRSYFERKGSVERFTLEERMAFWLRKCGSPAALFEVPEGTSDYDALARSAGVYKHPQVAHIACVDDPPEIYEARRARAYSPNHFVAVSVFYIDGRFNIAIIPPTPTFVHSSG